MAFVGLGVSGGIGAYKAVEVARLLQKRGHRVQAMLTKNARRFVGPLTFEAITRERVITTQFAPGMNADIEHIALATSLDVLLVAPATANVIAKFANGIADDFLSARPTCARWPRAACGSSIPARDTWRAGGSARAGLPSLTRSSRPWIPC
jgi:phosphopantothenoylcysteine decarboxylase/phosphopantothenate--cysteine ligase